MKKSLLALAALTAFAGAASAQSSVTLFGIVDVNARVTKNGSDTVYTQSQDGINSSRLGFRGVEDLGGGLRAGFWLEGALGPDTGTATGQTWQRRSTVSLLGGFGEIRLGRDYTPSFWNHTIFDVFGTNGVGSELNIYGLAGSGAGTLVRSNNSFGYFLPALGGFYGQIMVAPGEANAAQNKYLGARFGYGAGPVNVAFAYGKDYQTLTMPGDVVEWNVGGSYNLGFLQIMAQYNKSTSSAAATATRAKDVKSWTLSGAVPIGAGTIQASYGKTDVTLSTGKPSATQIALGYQYDLSKRTALYAHYSQIKNDAGVAFAVSTPPAIGSGLKSTGYEFGLRHSF